MDKELTALILLFANKLEALTKHLRDRTIGVDEWRSEFLKLIALYLTLAIGRPLSQAQESEVRKITAEQEVYLNGFAQDYVSKGWQESFLDRARMYAEAIREPYWESVTECLNLPIHPASDKLDCGSFCKCYLEIDWLDRAACSADVYWRTTTAEHSPDCTRLELEWNPLRVRNGVTQN